MLWYARYTTDTTWAVRSPIDILANQTSYLEVSIDADTLAAPHNTIIVLEGVTAGTQFEFEFSRTFEGMPKADSQVSTQVAVLDQRFSSPIDIIRKMDLQSVMRQPGESLMRSQMVYGLWTLPMMLAAKDLVKWGINKLGGSETVKDLLIKATPYLASYIVKKVPGLDAFEGEIYQAVLSASNSVLNATNDQTHQIDTMIRGLIDSSHTKALIDLALQYDIEKNPGPSTMMRVLQRALLALR